MALIDNDPFADITFQPAQPESPDVAAEILRSFNPQQTAYMPNTKGGVARINENTKVHGVTAYRGKDGKAVLTNERIIEAPTPAGADKYYNEAEFQAANPLVNGKYPLRGASQPAIIKPVDTPAGLFTILSKLKGSTDLPTATSLYESFQQTVVEQKTKIEQDAVKFAEQRIGIQQLERKLMEAEAADKADPMYYPGIGDSKITQALRNELNVARGVALNEAKTLLSTNQTYKSLAVTESTAANEYKRIQTLADKRETQRLQDENSASEWTRRAQERDTIRDENNRAKLEQEAEQVSGKMLARISLLHQADFAGLEAGSINAKVKALSLVKNNKNKDFNEAVSADDAALPVLALKGNKYATSLVLAEESAATGQSEEETANMIKALQKKMQEPDFANKVITRRYANVTDPEARKRAIGEAQATLLAPDRIKATDMRAQMALEEMELIKTNNFIANVGTWKSLDPELNAAIDKARKVAGRPDVESVLVAYLGDAEGPERAAKGSQFLNLARIATDRHAKSLFGKPDTGTINAIVVQHMRDSGFFGRWLNKLGNLPVNMDTVAGAGVALGAGALATVSAPVGIAAAAAGGAFLGGRALAKTLGKPNPTFIDPATGKPFGE